ncbi:MAG: hypothetical protein KDD82_00590 [Planctomycetes bacterium]|nr:hypothetical protein [Planctomycetota bacterium]
MRFAGLLFVLCLAVAQADILHLHNGRTLEGQIVQRTPTEITLRMNYGRMKVRVDQVREIERRLRPELELAERYREIDPSDPAALERLSLWASRRGLGREASDLMDHARGIRLERKLEAIQGSRRVQDWLEVYTWGRVNDVSETVLSSLLETAQGIDPDDRGLQAVLAAREEQARANARRQAEVERRRDEPTFKMPDARDRFVRSNFIPVVDQIEDESLSGRDRIQRIASGGGLRVRAPQPREAGAAEGPDARIRELEERLETQERKVAEQGERVSEQEAEIDRLRRLRSRVRRRGAKVPGGPELLRAKPLPPAPAEPAAPTGKPTVFR